MSTLYPTGIDTYSAKQDGVDTVFAAHVNNLQDAVHAIESTLGLSPQGLKTDVATRLGISINTDGTLANNIVSTQNIIVTGLTSPAIASGAIQQYHLAPGVGGSTVSVNGGSVSNPNFVNTSTLTWTVSGSAILGTAAGGGGGGGTGPQGPPGPAYALTTATVTAPIINSSVGVPVQTSGAALFAVNDYALLSDGIKLIFGQVTGISTSTVTIKRLNDSTLTNVAVNGYNFASGSTLSKSAVPIAVTMQRLTSLSANNLPISATGAVLPAGFVLPYNPGSGTVSVAFGLETVSMVTPGTAPSGTPLDINILKNGILIQTITLPVGSGSALLAASGTYNSGDLLTYSTGTRLGMLSSICLTAYFGDTF